MDEDVFRGKLKQYKDTVYRIDFTYLRNQADAEDVAQETFLKFYLREKPFPDVGSEKAWLIRVTLNACHNLRRSVWFQNRAELPENLATAFETPQDNALYAAVFSLPEKYRVVILLYYYEEYSVQEISEMLQRNPSTIQTQLERRCGNGFGSNAFPGIDEGYCSADNARYSFRSTDSIYYVL